MIYKSNQNKNLKTNFYSGKIDKETASRRSAFDGQSAGNREIGIRINLFAAW